MEQSKKSRLWNEHLERMAGRWGSKPPAKRRDRAEEWLESRTRKKIPPLTKAQRKRRKQVKMKRKREALALRPVGQIVGSDKKNYHVIQTVDQALESPLPVVVQLLNPDDQDPRLVCHYPRTDQSQPTAQ